MRGFASRYYNLTAGYNTPVNYFSSPTYDIDGVRAGNEEFADCRRVHLENMQAMSRLGDESYSCPVTPTTPTTTDTTITTSPPECGVEVDTGYTGNDVNWGPNDKQPDMESCRSFCKSSNYAPRPSFFGWIGSSGDCWCKTALDPDNKFQMDEVYSGPIECPTTPTPTTTTTTSTTTTIKSTTLPAKCGMENNVNYPGNDVNWGPNAKQPSAESCRSYCETSNWAPKPAFFTWIGSTDNHTPDARNACWCKTDLDQGERIDQVDVFSGPIMCPTTQASTKTTPTSMTTEQPQQCRDTACSRCNTKRKCKNRTYCKEKCQLHCLGQFGHMDHMDC